MRAPGSEILVPPRVLARQEHRFRLPAPPPLLAVTRVAQEVWERGSRAVRTAPYAACIVVRRGAMRIEHGERRWLCGPGSLALLPSGRRRTLTVLQRMECVIVNAVGPLLDAHLQALAPSVVGVVRLTPVEAGWYGALLTAAGAGRPEAAEVTAEAFASLLAVVRLRAPAVDRASAGASLVARASALVRSDPAAGMRVAPLAHRLGVHPDHLSRCFRAAGTLAPGALLRQARLARAQQLLRSGMSCARVADACGYADAFTFSKAFRRHHGESPSAWRDRTR